MHIHAARIPAGFVVLGLLVTFVPVIQADLYEFYNITNNRPSDAAIGEAQLSVDVTSHGTNQVQFVFGNTGPDASSITGVYFDDGAAPVLAGLAGIFGGPGVAFSEGGSVLPGGHEVSPPFVVTAGLQARSDPPVQPNGVNPGESLQLILDLQAEGDFADVINRLNAGDLRIGLHVQGFDSEGSESFINDPHPAPLPGAAVLGGLGLAMAAGALRRRKHLTGYGSV